MSGPESRYYRIGLAGSWQVVIMRALASIFAILIVLSLLVIDASSKDLRLNVQEIPGNAAQKAAAGVQHAVTEQKGEAWEDAVDAYQDVAKVIRARFQDDSQKLKLFSLIKQPTDIAGFLANAHNVFNVAMNNADVQEGLLKRKLTPEKLQEKYALIVALDEANQDQRGAIGDAQLATEAQDIALDQMHKWYAEYIKICRVALEDESQLLEKLGIPARTTRTKAQAAALRKRRETGEEEPMGC